MVEISYICMLTETRKSIILLKRLSKFGGAFWTIIIFGNRKYQEVIARNRPQFKFVLHERKNDVFFSEQFSLLSAGSIFATLFPFSSSF